MYNKYFEYLLSNDPQKVISKNGVKIRKIIHPLFLKLVPLTTKSTLTIEKKMAAVVDKPVIYAATHGFRDDVAFTLMTIGEHAYILYGSIPDFYESFDGIALWVNGSIIVDRKNKESRKASIEKMKYAMDLSANILMFPEGVWNKNPNAIVQKLYTGIYEVAKSKNALVIPVATILSDGKGYSIQGEPYDITELNNDKCYLILDKIKKDIKKVIDLIIYNDSKTNILKQKALNILDIIMQIDINNNIDFLESRIKYITALTKETLDYVQNVFDEEYWNSKNKQNIDIEKDIIKYISILLRDIVNAEARICTDDLRDKLATLKWQLISKYCEDSRDNFRKFNPTDKYWDEYLEELIKTANGLYDYEIENVAQYEDKTESTSEEVYSFLDNIKLNNRNALVLTKVRRSK